MFVKFIAHVYLMAWFTAPLGIYSPRLDLAHMTRLNEFNDHELAGEFLNIFKRHLWYCGIKN